MVMPGDIIKKKPTMMAKTPSRMISQRGGRDGAVASMVVVSP
jgi:hypothetical protein